MRVKLTYFKKDRSGNTVYENGIPQKGSHETKLPLKFGFGSYNEPRKVFYEHNLDVDDLLTIEPVLVGAMYVLKEVAPYNETVEVLGIFTEPNKAVKYVVGRYTDADTEEFTQKALEVLDEGMDICLHTLRDDSVVLLTKVAVDPK